MGIDGDSCNSDLAVQCRRDCLEYERLTRLEMSARWQALNAQGVPGLSFLQSLFSFDRTYSSRNK
jgi:hypothetical protein